jgi:hypothetical protein
MGIGLSIFGVVFAALCVWLTVRIVNRRERWAKWTLVVIVGLPVVYVASFGLACRLAAVPFTRYPGAAQIPRTAWMNTYRPLCWFTDRCDGSLVSETILRYVLLCIPKNSLIAVQMDGDPSHLWIVADTP